MLRLTRVVVHMLSCFRGSGRCVFEGDASRVFFRRGLRCRTPPSRRQGCLLSTVGVWKRQTRYECIDFLSLVGRYALSFLGRVDFQPFRFSTTAGGPFVFISAAQEGHWMELA